MKKYLIAVIFITPIINCFSQKMKIGLDGGATYSSFRGSEIIDDVKSGFGRVVGLSFEYFLAPNFSLKSNLNLEQKNNSYTGVTSSISYDNEALPIRKSLQTKNKNTYDYISLATMAKYYFGPDHSFFINGGGVYAHLNKDKTTTETKEIEFVNPEPTQRSNYPLAESFNHSDYGVTLGIGKSFIINDKCGLSIEFRDNLGLSNVIEDTMKYSTTGDIKTNSVNLLLGFEMNL